MRTERELTQPKLQAKGRRKPSRERYWFKHGKPTVKILKTTGYAKRLRREEGSVVQQVADLGSRSDVAVLKMAPADLVHNRAFAEHQQKLRGAIGRFRRVAAWQPFPRRVLIDIQRAAFVSCTKGDR